MGLSTVFDMKKVDRKPLTLILIYIRIRIRKLRDILRKGPEMNTLLQYLVEFKGYSRLKNDYRKFTPCARDKSVDLLSNKERGGFNGWVRPSSRRDAINVTYRDTKSRQSDGTYPWRTFIVPRQDVRANLERNAGPKGIAELPENIDFVFPSVHPELLQDYFDLRLRYLQLSDKVDKAKSAFYSRRKKEGYKPEPRKVTDNAKIHYTLDYWGLDQELPETGKNSWPKTAAEVLTIIDNLNQEIINVLEDIKILTDTEWLPTKKYSEHGIDFWTVQCDVVRAVDLGIIERALLTENNSFKVSIVHNPEFPDSEHITQEEAWERKEAGLIENITFDDSHPLNVKILSAQMVQKPSEKEAGVTA